MSPLAATGGQSHDAHDHPAPGGRAPEQLGKVSFPTSCDPKVHAQFERGVALLHSFWFGEGLKAFTAIAEQDPGCAMAHWGIAINRLLNPFTGEPGPGFLKQGQAAIEKAKEIGAKTQRERDYIDAAALLYTDIAAKPWRERAVAYEEALDASRSTGRGHMAQMFANAVAYEEMMGRWSKRLAVLFLDFVRIGDADKILDVGCGTGSLVQSILDRTRRAQIVGIDPAQAFIDYSRAHFPDARVIFDCGSALKLSYPDASFDHALSLLVFQFLQQPGTAAYEMRRVTRTGGTVAACTWDKAGQEMSDLFWEECVRLDPGAEEEVQRPKVCNQIGQLSELWRATGFEGVEEITLEMRTDFACFDDFWLPYTKGVGPQGMYVASLSPERREVLRDALRKRLVGDRDRPFSLRAAALAVRGTVPH